MDTRNKPAERIRAAIGIRETAPLDGASASHGDTAEAGAATADSIVQQTIVVRRFRRGRWTLTTLPV